MAKLETYVLGDDLPKENPWSDDRLGYKPFCERLAKVIVSLRAPNGYVIGLHGEWGSGKSTALNFVRRFLEKHNQECGGEKDRLTLVDFRPWIVSGHQDLVAAFFKVISESLDPHPGWWKRQWRRFMSFLQIGADPLVDAVAKVAVTVDPSAGVASRAIATVTKKSVGAMVNKFLEEPSLQAAYEDLKTKLAAKGMCFLVTIDDLDRLQDEEIGSIMQMVKTVGRLPNVIYLLAYDRSIVWKALDRDLERTGPRFAEKIVQQEIELPRPSRELLLAMLDEETAFLNEHVDGSSLRWNYIVRDGVHRWVRHPRDALRLANAVKFSWPALRGEIDAADLLAMEGVRLFDAEVFNWIRWNRDFLFSEGHYLMSRDETRDAAVKRLKENLTDDNREQLLRILTVLFPQHGKAFEGVASMGEEAHADTAARRGVGYTAGYDAYFGLHPSSDAIPKAVIDRIIASLGNQNDLRSEITPYIAKRDRSGQPSIGQLLEELRYRFRGSYRPEPTQELLDVLFEFGEGVLAAEWKADFFALSPRSQLSFLIEDLLGAWGQAKAGRHLIEAFRRCDSPAFCAAVFVDRGREMGKFPDRSSYMPKVTEVDFDALGKELLAKIERAAAYGTLANAPFYFDIARAWAYLGKSAEAEEWLSSGMIASPEFLSKVTRGLVSYTLGTQERSYRLSNRPEAVYDLKVILEAAAKHRSGGKLNKDELNRISAVTSGIEGIIERDETEAAKGPGG